jgi:hypothetical protein
MVLFSPLFKFKTGSKALSLLLLTLNYHLVLFGLHLLVALDDNLLTATFYFATHELILVNRTFDPK